jgi:lactate dehydrogenase-like 2-hydroxyacid dehydrogenase
MKVAILDDYQNVALAMADWSAVARSAEIVVFNDHIPEPAALVERLKPFDALCVMRERTPLPRMVIEQLSRLKLIASTGPRNASIDVAAAEERGIRIAMTGYRSTPTVELTWALILASARRLVGGLGPCDRAAGRPRSAGNSTAGHWGFWVWVTSAPKSPASPGLRDEGHRLESESDRRGGRRGRR